MSEDTPEYVPACNINVNLFHDTIHNDCLSTLDEDLMNLSVTTIDVEISTNSVLLIAVTDGGDTEALNQTVEETEENEALLLRDKLLLESPFLSDTVMVNSTTSEGVLPSIMVKEVLASNPKAAKSDKVQEALDNRTNQLP